MLLPAGFVFCDLASHSGVCGLKLGLVHRFCVDRLTVLQRDATVIAKEAADPKLDIEDFVLNICVRVGIHFELNLKLRSFSANHRV